MRTVLLLFLSLLDIFALDIKVAKQIVKLYKEKNYIQACKIGKKYFAAILKEAPLVTIVGDACSKEDDIDTLGVIVTRLNKTAIDRANASYFATLILEKKLIYQYMIDDIDLQRLSLPKTGHILSRVFENISNKNYTKLENKKIEIKDNNKRYILWVSNDTPKKVYIDEYENGILKKRHWFR